MFFYVYILQCNDGSYYVGHTDDMEKRIGAHHSGEYKGYTFNKRPVQLIWVDVTSSRYEAIAMERRIKGWSRVKKQALIKNDWERVSQLAKKVFKQI